MKNCSYSQCAKEVICKVIYGLYSSYKESRPHHEDFLCEEHLAELWEKSNGLVQCLLMHFVIESLENGR